MCQACRERLSSSTTYHRQIGGIHMRGQRSEAISYLRENQEISRDGGIGRRAGLKIRLRKLSESSSLSLGTKITS